MTCNIDIDHMKIAGVAILDMQMSKVPIISGYDSDPYMDRLRPSREYT
jgi:hypothetical protein